MNKLCYIGILFFIVGNQAIFSQQIGEAIKARDTLKAKEIDPTIGTDQQTQSDSLRRRQGD